MKFTKWNKSILYHNENERDIFLFKNQWKGKYIFISQLELVDFEYLPTPDNSWKIREGIKFKFIPIESITNNKTRLKSSPIINYNEPKITEREWLVISRVGQWWYRKALLEKWNYKCAVTSLDLTWVLIASHILPWKYASNKERLDPENGILLSPNLDALFDKHLISFNNDWKIIFSEKLKQFQINTLGLTNNMRLSHVTEWMVNYLKKHREKIDNRIQVVAWILRNKNWEILIAKRKAEKSFWWKWEFPGWKIEFWETPQKALERELFEEFWIQTYTKDFITTSNFDYPNFKISLHVYESEYLNGDFSLIDHDETIWANINKLHEFDMPNADIPIIELLKE
jgi:mutator protein MutT